MTLVQTTAAITPIRSNSQPHIITLYDAITDSPIYRVSTLRFDQQLEAFNRWISDLSQQSKRYAERLKQLNEETVSLANKLDPTGIMNDHLLDAKITSIAANHFTEALKTNLIFKSKTVSDLEGKFIQPIQHFADTQIHDFKIFRKRHQEALDNYETILATYNALGEHDESSECFHKLEAARKLYTELSSEHVLRIIKIRSAMEHCLVQQFSTTTLSRKEFYDDAQVWKQLNTMLFSWSQWLEEDKLTCQIEIQKHQVAQQLLVEEYLRQRQPAVDRKIKHAFKSGYLFIYLTEPQASWKRQWFFVHDGYFGSCTPSGIDNNITITMNECIPLHLCEIKPVDSIGRRFCFEVLIRQASTKSRRLLQAEDDQDMYDWMAIMARTPTSSSTNKFGASHKARPSSIILGNYDPNNDPSQPRSPALLIAKSKSTTVVTTPTDIPVTLSTNTSNISGYSNLSQLSSSPVGTVQSTLSRSQSTTTTSSCASAKRQQRRQQGQHLNPRLPTVKITCTSFDQQDDLNLHSAPSMMPLLLREIARELQGTVDESTDTINWGSPRFIIAHDNGIISADKDNDALNGIGEDNFKLTRGRSIWPLPLQSNPTIPDIPGYTDLLAIKNQELRELFYGVSPQEVVLDAFVGSFYKKQHISDPLAYQDQKLNHVHQPFSEYGYSYSGNAYITQDALWFYSNISASCITTVALKLQDIDDIQVIHGTGIMLDVIDDNDSKEQPATSPIVFSLQLDDAEIVAEKLRFLIYNAKLSTPMQLRNVFRKVLSLSSLSTSSTTSLSTSSSEASFSHSTPRNSSSRMESSTTTTTIDTAATLVASPLSSPTVKKGSIKKKKTKVTKPFTDPDVLPSDIEKPAEPISCNCEDHLDRRDAEIELPISAKRLFDLMFSDESCTSPTSSSVWHSKTKGIDGHDLRITPWEPLSSDGQSLQPDGLKQRILKYWMPVTNPVVRMKEAEVVETQILLKKDDYLCYVIQISTKTETLPFADAFIPSVRYCITYVDDSRCKLMCHLGVKWLKWVMAKLIVTKAALSGMSDSIAIFIPILKEAASTVQLSVEDLRQAEHARISEGISEYEDVVTGSEEENHPCEATMLPSTLNNSMTRLSTSTTKTMNQQHVDDKQDDKPHEQSDISNKTATTKNINHNDNHATHKLLTETPSLLKRSLTLSNSDLSRQPPTSARVPQMIKEKLTDASGKEAPSLVNAAIDSIWPPTVWTVCNAILACILLFTWLRGTSLALDNPQPYGTTNTTVLSRAIYLRDLDEGYLKKSSQPPYSGTQCYDLFLKTKKDERHHRWNDGQHYQLSIEYTMSRQQLGTLRYDMMTMFQALNLADSYLLENEYLNWLLDYRQGCRSEQKFKKSQQQTIIDYNDTSSSSPTFSSTCDQVNYQIGTYF